MMLTSSSSAFISCTHVHFRYSSSEEAERAIRHFDKTFIDTSRIEVQFTSKVGDDSMAHSRNHKLRASTTRPTSDAQAPRPSNQLSQDLALLKKLQSGEDQELKAFASSLRNRSQTQVWANDDVAFEQSGPLSVPSAEALENVVFNDDGGSSSDESVQACFSRVCCSYACMSGTKICEKKPILSRTIQTLQR